MEATADTSRLCNARAIDARHEQRCCRVCKQCSQRRRASRGGKGTRHLRIEFSASFAVCMQTTQLQEIKKKIVEARWIAGNCVSAPFLHRRFAALVTGAGVSTRKGKRLPLRNVSTLRSAALQIARLSETHFDAHSAMRALGVFKKSVETALRGSLRWNNWSRNSDPAILGRGGRSSRHSQQQQSSRQLGSLRVSADPTRNRKFRSGQPAGLRTSLTRIDAINGELSRKQRPSPGRNRPCPPQHRDSGEGIARSRPLFVLHS